MNISTQQAAYAKAKQNYETIKKKLDSHERDFLAARSVIDQRGLPALHIWQVTDDSLFDELDAEYEADASAVKLQTAYTAARVEFIKAEHDLIAWALSIVPAGIRSTLAPAAKHDSNVRKKVIDLAIRLDSSTIAV